MNRPNSLVVTLCVGLGLGVSSCKSSTELCTAASGVSVTSGMGECRDSCQCVDLCRQSLATAIAPRTIRLDAGASSCERGSCTCVNEFGATFATLDPSACSVLSRVGTCLYQPDDGGCSTDGCRAQCGAMQAAIDADNQRTLTLTTVAGECTVSQRCRCVGRTNLGCVDLDPTQSGVQPLSCADAGL